MDSSSSASRWHSYFRVNPFVVDDLVTYEVAASIGLVGTITRSVTYGE